MPEKMTDQDLDNEIRFLQDRLATLEAEQKRRAVAFLEAKLGKEGSRKVIREAERALNAPSTVRRMFWVRPE